MSSMQDCPITSLGDNGIATIIMGQSPPSSTYNSTQEGLPFFQGKKEFGEKYPVASTYCDMPIKIAEEGDILISVRAPVGPTNLADRQCCIGRGLAAIRTNKEKLNTQFMLYFLKAFESKIASEGQGSTFKAISKKQIEALDIPLPPLAEQKRIVEKLDALMERITELQSKTEESLGYAETIFSSFLDGIYADFHNGSLNLGEVSDFRNGINYKKTSNGESIEIVGVKDFKNNFWAPLDGLDAVNVDGTLPDNDLLEENDLVFVRSNGNVELIGRCMLVGKHTKRLTHSGFTIRARLTTDKLLPEFLCYYLKSSLVRRKMIGGGAGANIKSLNQTVLSAINVPVPSIAKQKEVIQIIRKVEEESLQLAKRVADKKEYLVNLQASVLDAAFSGTLVT